MRNDAVEHVLLHPTSPSLQSGACRWANGELTPLTRRVPTLFSHSSLSSLSQQLLQSETLRHHIDITLALRTYLLTSQGRRRCLSGSKTEPCGTSVAQSWLCAVLFNLFLYHSQMTTFANYTLWGHARLLFFPQSTSFEARGEYGLNSRS